MAYMAQLYEPLRSMSTNIPELQSALASLHRAFALLEETPELEARPEAANPFAESRVRWNSATSRFSTRRAGAAC